eukprot:scaffold104_cov375-Prasinococcus_capsulatus_cf.AAC.36
MMLDVPRRLRPAIKTAASIGTAALTLGQATGRKSPCRLRQSWVVLDQDTAASRDVEAASFANNCAPRLTHVWP